VEKDPNRGRVWRMIRQSGGILILSAATGLLANHVRPDNLPLVAEWAPEARLTTGAGEKMVISLEEARTWCLKDNVVFIDARSPQLFAEGHIRCSQNIPWQSFDQYTGRVFDTIPEDTLIVTYCDGEHCSLSEDLAKELMAMGYQKVKVLVNGWTRWQEAGFPTEKG